MNWLDRLAIALIPVGFVLAFGCSLLLAKVFLEVSP